MDYSVTMPEKKNIKGSKQQRKALKQGLAQCKSYEQVSKVFGFDVGDRKTLAELVPVCQAIYEKEKL